MKRVSLFVVALVVCGLVTAAVGAEFPLADIQAPGNNPNYQPPGYANSGQPFAGAWQHDAAAGNVYTTGYARNYAYGGGTNCGPCAAGPCGMNYGMIPMALGCCEYSPSCCDHIWDGWCEERQARQEQWRNFYLRLKSSLSRGCGGGCGYGGCGCCCRRAASCQVSCECAAPAGTVSEASAEPSAPAPAAPRPAPKPAPKAAPKPAPKPAPEPKAPAPPKPAGESPAEPGRLLPPPAIE